MFKRGKKWERKNKCFGEDWNVSISKFYLSLWFLAIFCSSPVDLWFCLTHIAFVNMMNGVLLIFHQGVDGTLFLPQLHSKKSTDLNHIVMLQRRNSIAWVDKNYVKNMHLFTFSLKFSKDLQDSPTTFCHSKHGIQVPSDEAMTLLANQLLQLRSTQSEHWNCSNTHHTGWKRKDNFI